MRNKFKPILTGILLIISFLIIPIPSNAKYQPFAGKTKHKTIKRMSKREFNRAKKGETLYFWKNKKLKKRKRNGQK